MNRNENKPKSQEELDMFHHLYLKHRWLNMCVYVYMYITFQSICACVCSSFLQDTLLFWFGKHTKFGHLKSHLKTLGWLKPYRGRSLPRRYLGGWWEVIIAGTIMHQYRPIFAHEPSHTGVSMLFLYGSDMFGRKTTLAVWAFEATHSTTWSLAELNSGMAKPTLELQQYPCIHVMSWQQGRQTMLWCSISLCISKFCQMCSFFQLDFFNWEQRHCLWGHRSNHLHPKLIPVGEFGSGNDGMHRNGKVHMRTGTSPSGAALLQLPRSLDMPWFWKVLECPEVHIHIIYAYIEVYYLFRKIRRQ